MTVGFAVPLSLLAFPKTTSALVNVAKKVKEKIRR